MTRGQKKTAGSPERRPGDAIRVAVVDDHPAVRHGLVSYLEQRGDMCVCGEAESPAEALEIVERNEPSLLIIDISLESGSGLELIKQIAARFADVRMLVYSMHDEKLYADRVVRAGAHGFVGKSAGLDKLGAAIDRVCDDKIYLSEELTGIVLERRLRGENADLPSPRDLSDRELEVFEAIGRGQSTREIAEQLGLSVKTVETHRENIKRKLGLGKNMELLQRAFQWVMESDAS